MLNIAVVDDSIESLNVFSGAIKGAFSSFGVDVHVDSFSKSESFIEGFVKEEYDIYFLDVNMPKYSGIEIAKKLRNQGNSNEIVFVSSDEQKVFECFSVTPFGFIRKDKFLNDLSKIVNLYMTTNDQKIKQDRIKKIKINGDTVSINIYNVLYAEGNRNYQMLHMNDSSSINLRLPMKELESKLEPYGFIRIQKGFLVNYRFIRKINSESITLTNNVNLTLSKHLKKDVMKKYLELTSENEFLNF